MEDTSSFEHVPESDTGGMEADSSQTRSNWILGVEESKMDAFVQAIKDAALASAKGWKISPFKNAIISELVNEEGLSQKDAEKLAEDRAGNMTSMVAPLYRKESEFLDSVNKSYFSTHSIRAQCHFLQQQQIVAPDFDWGVTGGLWAQMPMGGNHLSVQEPRMMIDLVATNGHAAMLELIRQMEPALAKKAELFIRSATERYQSLIDGTVHPDSRVHGLLKQIIVPFSGGDVSLSPADCPQLGNRIKNEVSKGIKKKVYFRAVGTDLMISNLQSAGFSGERARLLAVIEFKPKRHVYGAAQAGLVGRALPIDVLKAIDGLPSLIQKKRTKLSKRKQKVDMNSEFETKFRGVVGRAIEKWIQDIFDTRDQLRAEGLVAKGNPDAAFLNGVYVGLEWADSLANRMSALLVSALSVRPDDPEQRVIDVMIKEKVHAVHWN